MARPAGSDADARVRELERQLAELRLELTYHTRVLQNTLLKDGERPLEGPLIHTGPLVGFFGVTPSGPAPFGLSVTDAVAALIRFGLMRAP